MALLFADGFAYALDAQYFWWWQDGAVVWTTAIRNSAPNNHAVRVTDNTTSRGLLHYLKSPSNIITVGMGIYISSAASRSICTLRDTGTIQGSLVAFYQANGLHLLGYRLSNNGTIYYSDTGLRLGVWNHVEWQLRVHNTAGYSIVRLNGKTVIEEYNIDTQATANETINSFKIGANNSYGSDENYYDDVYICDTSGTVNNGFLGDVIVETLFPADNGLTNSFVGSDGNSNNNFQLVDDAGYVGDTTYTEGSGQGSVELYSLDSLSNASLDIKGIQVQNQTRKVGNAPTTGVHIIAQSGTIYSGNLFVPGEGVYDLAALNFWETDPSTAANWHYSGINDLQIGIKVV